jgi:hypothetical protein
MINTNPKQFRAELTDYLDLAGKGRIWNLKGEKLG